MRQRVFVLSFFVFLLVLVDCLPFVRMVRLPGAELWRQSEDRAISERLGHLVGADAFAASDACRTPPRLAPFLNRPMDINRAEVRDLTLLPGIGPTLAARIVANREAQGAYGSPRALLRVTGIGPATLAKIEPRLCTR